MAQLDRFILGIRLGYLDEDGEVELVRGRVALEQVEVAGGVSRYAAQVVAATRTHPRVVLGASPRGRLALIQLAGRRLGGRPSLRPARERQEPR